MGKPIKSIDDNRIGYRREIRCEFKKCSFVAINLREFHQHKCEVHAY